jgi:ERCC4-type nuclease
MKIILDVRENALIEKMGQYVEKQQLPLGDVVLQKENGETYLIFERKTLSDLLASVKDGRYEEQSHRLMYSTTIPRHHIFYIIEGNLQFLQPYEKKLVHSVISSISLYKGFSVLKTLNSSETAEMILSLYEKINKNNEKGKVPYYLTDTTPSDGHPEMKSYSEFVKTVKKDNITPENISEILLCQIPGISSVTSQAIIQKFDGSFSKMCEEINSSDEPLLLFKDIVLEKDGKKRKINKNCGENIVKYLQCKKEI